MALERQVILPPLNHIDLYLYHDQGKGKNESGALRDLEWECGVLGTEYVVELTEYEEGQAFKMLHFWKVKLRELKRGEIAHHIQSYMQLFHFRMKCQVLRSH